MPPLVFWLSQSLLSKNVLDLEKVQRRVTKVVSANGWKEPSGLGLFKLEKISIYRVLHNHKWHGASEDVLSIYCLF